jgi:hypothetical protein
MSDLNISDMKDKDKDKYKDKDKDKDKDKKIILNNEYSRKRLLLMERLLKVSYSFGCYSDQAEKVENDLIRLDNKYLSDLSGMS